MRSKTYTHNNRYSIRVVTEGHVWMSIGKELPDGTMAWLDLDSFDVMPGHIYQLTMLRHRLENAVFAAREYRRQLRNTRKWYPLGTLGAAALIAKFFGVGKS